MKETKKNIETKKIDRDKYILQCKQEVDMLGDIKGKWDNIMDISYKKLITRTALSKINLICECISSNQKEF